MSQTIQFHNAAQVAAAARERIAARHAYASDIGGVRTIDEREITKRVVNAHGQMQQHDPLLQSYRAIVRTNTGADIYQFAGHQVIGLKARNFEDAVIAAGKVTGGHVLEVYRQDREAA